MCGLAVVELADMLDQLAGAQRVGGFQPHDSGGLKCVDEALHVFGAGGHHVVYHAQGGYHFQARALAHQVYRCGQDGGEDLPGWQVVELADVFGPENVERAGHDDYGPVRNPGGGRGTQNLISCVHAGADSSQS